MTEQPTENKPEFEGKLKSLLRSGRDLFDPEIYFLQTKKTINDVVNPWFWHSCPETTLGSTSSFVICFCADGVVSVAVQKNNHADTGKKSVYLLELGGGLWDNAKKS